METEQIQSQEIVVPRDRKKQLSPMISLSTPMILLIVLCITGIFKAPHNDGKLLFAVMSLFYLSSLIFIAWLFFRALRSTFLLKVNREGTIFIDAYRLSFKSRLIPWSEIAKLSYVRSQSVGFLLTLTLKDPQRWWSLYGNGGWRRLRTKKMLCNAHFGINQQFVTISLRKVLQQIQENYAQELRLNEVEVMDLTSPLAARYSDVV